MIDTQIRESLHGLWQVTLRDGKSYPVKVPGSLDENGIGQEDVPDCETRLTRTHTWTGPAVYTLRHELKAEEGQRLFLYVERARQMHLSVDGFPVAERSGTLSTPWTWELTPWADGCEHTLALTTDNSYPGWPAKAICYSSTATDETQTNWNGLLGEVSLRTEPKVFVDGLRLLMKDDTARVVVTLDSPENNEGTVEVRCDAFTVPAECAWKIGPGRTEIVLPVMIAPEALRWDELESHLYRMTAELSAGGS